ncbi:MAG: type VII secretion protein EssB/YukC [Coprobacillaceae bacterium]
MKEKQNKVKENKQKSLTNIKDIYDIEKVQEKQHHLIPCSIHIKEEIIEYEYCMEGLESMINIHKMTMINKLQILIGIAKLEELTEEYSFSMNPNNLYYTKDVTIKVKERDVLENNTDISFINCYKSLIGSTFLKEYSYEDLLEGGLSLLQKEEVLKEVVGCHSVKEIVLFLDTWFEEENKLSKNMISISKTKNSIFKIWMVGVNILFVTVSIFTGYQQLYVIKEKEVLLEASHYFIDNKYVDTIDVLNNQDINSLNIAGRYMLAVSYIKSSNLNREARDNVLSQLKMNGNKDYILFWIYLGQKNFEQVYTIVNTFVDEQLLHYAYSVELESLATNTMMSVEEKTKRKAELEKFLDGYIVELETQLEQDSQ